MLCASRGKFDIVGAVTLRARDQKQEPTRSKPLTLSKLNALRAVMAMTHPRPSLSASAVRFAIPPTPNTRNSR
jgi:hypothetical protein